MPDTIDHDSRVRPGYTRENVKADIDIGCTVVASIHDLIALPGATVPARSPGCTSVNKFQNIRARPTRCSSWPNRDGGARPGRGSNGAGWTAGGRGRGDRDCRSGPLQADSGDADCIEAIEEYREAGCIAHVMLELWGDRRHEQIRLFGEKVLPQPR